MFHSRSAVFALSAGIVFVSGAPRGTSGALVAPCSLLTQAQVSAALGVSVGAGASTAGKICRWAGPGNQPGRRPAVVVTLQDEKALAIAKSPTTSATLVKTTVSGVGDDAVFNTVGVVTATLTVKKGDTYFEVHVYGFPVDQTKTLEQKLAEDIVAKLK